MTIAEKFKQKEKLQNLKKQYLNRKVGSDD